MQFTHAEDTVSSILGEKNLINPRNVSGSRLSRLSFKLLNIECGSYEPWFGATFFVRQAFVEVVYYGEQTFDDVFCRRRRMQRDIDVRNEVSI